MGTNAGMFRTEGMSRNELWVGQRDGGRSGLMAIESKAKSLFGAVGLFGKGSAQVANRLDLFVSTAVQEEPTDVPDYVWVQEHNTRVRQSLKGSKDITKRLNGETDEVVKERPPERVMKGTALYLKMLEQRRRSAEPKVRPI